ncbi:uncharacterized protein DS421_20g700230 [Arachis hypogaea]|nr:uncharacterized protein DS421_20g700230 [Arachis hypogaea]
MVQCINNKGPLDSSTHKPVLSKRETSKASIFGTPTAEASLEVANEVEGSKKKNGSEGLGSKKNNKRKVKNDADVATEALDVAEKSTSKEKKQKQ